MLITYQKFEHFNILNAVNWNESLKRVTLHKTNFSESSLLLPYSLQLKKIKTIRKFANDELTDFRTEIRALYWTCFLSDVSSKLSGSSDDERKSWSHYFYYFSCLISFRRIISVRLTGTNMAALMSYDCFLMLQ